MTYEPPSFAMGDATPLVERAERTVTTLLVGKLRSPGKGVHLCRVRNISRTGMMVEAQPRLGFGSWVAVELRGGETLQGTVAWSGTGRAGVEFTLPVDVDRVLADAKMPQQQRHATQPRAPRFDVDCAGRINSNGRYIDVRVENISQSGVRLRLPRPPRGDTQVILDVPGLPPRRAVTRWAAEDVAGLSFLDVIPYHDLAAWLDYHPAER